ncbi:MAG: pyridoxamine 5'-phosphate oxidase [Chitinophagaceae bacterium]|nr:MAG: pyridoxamine 5'-phosphate oxidase [Chitinophagaceae bacterium]
MSNIADIRKDYKQQTLNEGDVAADPIEQFAKWWEDATSSDIEEVNAMTLATANTAGRPSARIVLLKGFDAKGFVFYTNYNSHKGMDIAANPYASLVFFWKELERQVRVEGKIEKVAAADSDAYFNSRPLSSRIGAWASPQSSVIPSRDTLEKNVQQLEEKMAGTAISRPEHWGGYIVRPDKIEFWQGRPSRLHDRIQYSKQGGSWELERLAP